MPFVLAMLFVVPSVAWGQARTEGQLGGTVVDPSGAAVPGASLTLNQASTGFTTTVKANASGVYVFPDLQPGTYVLTASASGFQTQTYNSVVINAARTTDLKVALKVGTSSQTVEVSAQSEILETSSNTLATTLNPDSIQNLPLAGRDVLPLALLVPGAQSGGSQRFTTYNALPNGAINITVDGMNDNFQRYRTSTTGFFTAAPLRLGAIEEATISTNNLTADAGSEGATTLRFVTKRGHNQFHGGGVWQVQNSFFNANTYTNNARGVPLPKLHRNDYGGNIGGPILKNKLFFFFNYEQQVNHGNSLNSEDILTQDAQNGLFSYTGTDNAPHQVCLFTATCPLTGQQGIVDQYNASHGTNFPAAVNSAIGSQFTAINGFSKSGSFVPTNLGYMQELDWVQNTVQPNRYPTLRLDYQITPNIAWHGSWDVFWRSFSPSEIYPGDQFTNNGFKSTYATISTGLDWTITPNLVNQANFGLLNTQERFNAGNSFSPFESEGNIIIGSPNFVNLNGAPGAVLTTVVPSYALPEPRNNPVWDVTDNLTWTHGNHTFTFGGDLRISNQHDASQNDPPTYTLSLNSQDPAINMFSQSAGLFPALDYSQSNQQDQLNAENLYATLVGRISNIAGFNYVDTQSHDYKILGLAIQWEKQTVGGIYFQDAWKATPHFALNYGFRWQMTGAIHNTSNYFTSPKLPDLYGPSSGLFQPGQLNGVTNPQVYLQPAPYKADLHQPAPNFGFAWNPDIESGFLGRMFGGSNTVVRGGAALSYFDEGWTVFEQAAYYDNPGATQSVFLNPGFGAGQFVPGSLNLGDPVPTLNAFPSSFSPPFPESDFTFNSGFGSVNPNLRPPYVESWYLGVQRKLPGNTVVEVNYVGNHSVHLWMVYDINEVNIFENGFLTEFKNAQANLAANNGTSFANTGAPGTVPLPIMEQAFGGTGSSVFTNDVSLVSSGQAGALANVIVSNSNYFCNLVGNTFSPCVTQGINPNAPTPVAYPINMFQANPYASGFVAHELSNPGSSSYNGLQVQVKHPIGHGLNFTANYAFSHAFTNRYIGDYYTSDEAIANFTTLRNPGLNRVPSPYDMRHTFQTFWTYDLPFGRARRFETGNRVLDNVIGGWTFGSILTWQTGRNFKLTGGTNTFNYFANNSGAPDLTDSGVVLNGISTSQLQSMVGVYPGPTPTTPVVVLPASVQTSSKLLPETTPGQLGSFVFLKGPVFFNTDMSLVKSIPIFDRLRMDVYAEFLNAFNHTNWNVTDNFSGRTNNPAQYLDVTSAPFAGARLADGPRTIQFRLQLAF